MGESKEVLTKKIYSLTNELNKAINDAEKIGLTVVNNTQPSLKGIKIKVQDRFEYSNPEDLFLR